MSNKFWLWYLSNAPAASAGDTCDNEYQLHKASLGQHYLSPHLQLETSCSRLTLNGKAVNFSLGGPPVPVALSAADEVKNVLVAKHLLQCC